MAYTESSFTTQLNPSWSTDFLRRQLIDQLELGNAGHDPRGRYSAQPVPGDRRDVTLVRRHNVVRAVGE